jgi:hypothetical protein
MRKTLVVTLDIILMLIIGALGIYGVYQRHRADKLDKLLTATVEQCSDAWLTEPIK